MAFFDFFKRKSGRGVRDDLRGERHPHQPTKTITVDGAEIPAPAPPQSPPAPGGSPPATVIVPRPDPVSPHPSPGVPISHPQLQPPPAAEQLNDPGGKTKIVDVKSLFQSQVVGVLVAIEGEFEGEVYKLVDGENQIGRTKDCQVQIASQYISRPHAMLIHRDGMFAIRSLASQSPTFVNENRVEDVSQLTDGASIKVGRTTLRFRSIA